MEITSKIDQGSCAEKPGWIRLSIHPTTSSQEIEYLCKAVKELAQNHEGRKDDYDLNFDKGVISHKNK
jgi:hypothetical protein